MKTTSEKRLAANRRNALKSTGPKTQQGKAVVSRNALKYGVLSEAVVVRGHALQESAQEYEDLCREFHESLVPVGMLEEMLTGQIAATAWRLRRVAMGFQWGSSGCGARCGRSRLRSPARVLG